MKSILLGLFIDFSWLFLLTPKPGFEIVKAVMMLIGTVLIIYGLRSLRKKP